MARGVVMVSLRDFLLTLLSTLTNTKMLSLSVTERFVNYFSPELFKSALITDVEESNVINKNRDFVNYFSPESVRSALIIDVEKTNVIHKMLSKELVLVFKCKT